MNQGTRPPTDVQDAVKTICDEKGLSEAMKLLGMSRESVMRLSSGNPVRAGTIALAQQKLKLTVNGNR